MLKIIILNLIAFPFLSRLYGRLTRIRHPQILTRFIIKKFIAHYKIDMSTYQGQASDFASLSDFFVRPLNPARRPLHPNHEYILSPSDGTIAELQKIDTNHAVQVKGLSYKVSDLIGEELDWSLGWWLCTIYLSPANYHRFHYPWSGKLLHVRQLGNRLFPVNRHGVEAIDRLFVRNERLVCAFDLQGERCFATAVGATFVGNIVMTALSEPLQKRGLISLDQSVEQMDEMGRFMLGSTIILLLPQKMGTPAVSPLQAIQTGKPLFKRS